MRANYYEYRNGTRLIPPLFRRTSVTCFAKTGGQATWSSTAM